MLENYHFNKVKDQNRPIELRMRELEDRINSVTHPNNLNSAILRSVRISGPIHRNGDWEIEILLLSGNFVSSRIPTDILQKSSDEEILRFIQQGVRDAEDEENKSTIESSTD